MGQMVRISKQFGTYGPRHASPLQTHQSWDLAPTERAGIARWRQGLADEASRGETARSDRRRDATSAQEPVFEPGHPRHVPASWPMLLSRDQLCAYIGVSPATLTKICPVRPLDLGASLIRYSRDQIDEWVATLPPRLMVAHRTDDALSGMAAGNLGEAETRAESALDRVRARAEGSRWRKTA